MSEVGYAQSEAEVTVDAYDDFLSNDEFESIMAAADAERAADPVASEVTPEQKQAQAEAKTERNESREETKQQLAGHFGSQQFFYTDEYKGTVSQLIARCPAIDAILDQGFEYVCDWLEPHKVEEEVLNKGEDEDELSENPVHNKDESLGESSQVDESLKAAEQSKVVVKDVIEKQRAADIKGASDTAVKEPIQAESDTPTAPREEEVVLIASAENGPVQTPRVEVPIFESARAVVESKVDTENGEEVVAHTEPIVELEAKPQPIADEIEPEAAAVMQPHEIRVGPEAASSVVGSTDAREGATDSLDATSGTGSVDAIESEPIDLSEILENDNESIAPESSELEAEAAVDYFDSWHEIAHDEPPLDDLFIAIADQLETSITKQDADTETVVRLESIMHHQLEVSDEELVQSSQPEVFALFTAIRSARKSVEALYSSRTKEECRYHIEQVVEELSTVLRALGYDNPEVIIRAFLSNHSPESLKSLIIELENSLRRTLVREIQQRQASHAKSRHTRLSKFVGFIMQALAPRSGAMAETA